MRHTGTPPAIAPSLPTTLRKTRMNRIAGTSASRSPCDASMYSSIVLLNESWSLFAPSAKGGEDDETPLQTAGRETQEEIGVEGDLLPLDSMSTVPRSFFSPPNLWDSDIYVIPVYCFAVDVGADEIRVSEEHTDHRWVSYQQAEDLLKWDNNRIAMWELRERLVTSPAS